MAVDELIKIINKNRWLTFEEMNALFVEDGNISSATFRGKSKCKKNQKIIVSRDKM